MLTRNEERANKERRAYQQGTLRSLLVRNLVPKYCLAWATFPTLPQQRRGRQAGRWPKEPPACLRRSILCHSESQGTLGGDVAK